MAANLVRIDASAGSCVVTCACGYRSSVCTDVATAELAADRHRAAMHPAQLRDALKKRRRRDRARSSPGTAGC